MMRRIVTLLLLPCVVLSQAGAAFAHAHGGAELAEHGSRPHVHAPFRWADHDCDRHCHHDGAGHHGSDHHVTQAVPPSGSDESLPQQQHNSDAVYVACVDALARSRTSFDDQTPKLVTWASIGLHALSGGSDTLARQQVASQPAPVSFADACPLYILQLAMLI